MAVGSTKSATTRDARRSKARRRRGAARRDSTLDVIERLLSRRISISMRGEPKQVCAAEAIVLQLLQKALSGNMRAWRALLKYQEFAKNRSEISTELRFVESEYTRAFAKSSSRIGIG
jgi:hypothetical protein